MVVVVIRCGVVDDVGDDVVVVASELPLLESAKLTLERDERDDQEHAAESREARGPPTPGLARSRVARPRHDSIVLRYFEISKEVDNRRNRCIHQLHERVKVKSSSIVRALTRDATNCSGTLRSCGHGV